MERLVNAVIQASKKINKMIPRLALSYFSLFAAVQYIMKNVEDVGNKNILCLEQVKLDVIPVKI
jgi:glutamyl-tRNA reductase